MNLALISFTKAGSILNSKLVSLLNDSDSCTGFYKGRCEENTELLEVEGSLGTWCKEMFEHVDGIIFIGAAGIAVRTIAPFIQDKTKDPLVLVIDEKGKFVISLLSGHIGGGNNLTIAISNMLKATPVITTATDINQKFAVDVFATKEKLYISDKTIAKEISASILDGSKVGFVSYIDVSGNIPEELELVNHGDLGICISFDEKTKPFKETLTLIPKRITLGVGCKKDTDTRQFEEYMLETLESNHISIHSIKNIASIDLKAEEPCILAFAKKYGLEFITFSKDELCGVQGDFEESEFVQSITGVGNVCERSAMSGCQNGSIILKKLAKNGITIALAKEMRGIQFE